MIKATELRIGNLIKDDNDNGSIETVRSLELFNDEVVVNDDQLARYTGIPLTEEWLLKFGFSRKTHTWIDGSVSEDYFWCGKYYALMDDDVVSLGRRDITQNKPEFLALLVYVHQLQNLYVALTGEELTIKETA